jgi:hypothetical protein
MTESLDIQKKAVLRLLHAYAPQNEKVDPLLVVSLGRVLLKGAKRNEDIHSLVTGDQVRHIYDWLKAEVLNGAEWLSNCDEKGRPRKLLKFGSVAQIVQEADQAMEKANQGTGKVSLIEGDEVLIAELEDGYSLVRMLTPAALDRESQVMQHCIGNGGYDDELTKEWARFLSLRDASGNPHVTMDISINDDRMNINQIKGKQNAVPIAKYLSILRPWFAEMKATLTYMPERGLMVSSNEEIYHASELPDDFECKRDFRAHELEGARIPERLKVHGHMSIISYDGENTQSHLPEGLYVGGDLTIRSPMIEVISKNTTVKGTLRASCSNISAIGEGLTVFGDCYLANTKIEKLPSKLTVIGKLFIGETQVKEIGESVIFSSLDASGSYLDAVPTHIKEYDELKIDGTSVKGLPEGLSISRFSATNVDFASFPENLRVEDDLILYRANIPVLFDTLKLPLDSCFAVSKIGEMRGDIVFEGPIRNSVDFTDAKIGKLPDSITVIDGDLILNGTDISTLPRKLHVTHNIDLLHMENLKELPSDCELSCEKLLLDHDSKFEIPKHWKVKTVALVGGGEYETTMTAEEYRQRVRKEFAMLESTLKF